MNEHLSMQSYKKKAKNIPLGTQKVTFYPNLCTISPQNPYFFNNFAPEFYNLETINR